MTGRLNNTHKLCPESVTLPAQALNVFCFILKGPFLFIWFLFVLIVCPALIVSAWFSLSHQFSCFWPLISACAAWSAAFPVSPDLLEESLPRFCIMSASYILIRYSMNWRFCEVSWILGDAQISKLKNLMKLDQVTLILIVLFLVDELYINLDKTESYLIHEGYFHITRLKWLYVTHLFRAVWTQKSNLFKSLI